MPKLVCMMGLPRSGKSTAARKLSLVFGAPVVNRDSIRLALHGQRYQKLAEPMVKATAVVMVRALFLAGHDVVVVDETNVRRSTRDFWRDGEWDTEFLEVPTSPAVCLERARVRKDAEIGPVILKMHDEADPLEDDEPRFNPVRWGDPHLSTGQLECVRQAMHIVEASVSGYDLEVARGACDGAAG